MYWRTFDGLYRDLYHMDQGKHRLRMKTNAGGSALVAIDETFP